jgi:hypothetical protein
MKIWLVTTGSSDVQLKTSECWGDWYRLINQDCYRLPFVPTQAVRDLEDPYCIAPRVLGMAYQVSPDEIWSVLKFPLLEGFTARLKDESIAQIILLLTDQSRIFDETQRDDLKCPYWQDTYELRPIFERYFQAHFPSIELVPLKIAPQLGESGLDDWNFVLEYVHSQLKKISEDPTTVYVSHQAGTPAISSAVQFSSLARFGDRVTFLVSSEQNTRPPEILLSSSYLKGIRKQEAEKLLKRHDYAGVKNLISDYLNGEDHAETRILLDAAIQWNFAKFDEFANIIEKLPSQNFEDLIQEAKNHRRHWWWIAYEAAYLGVVRLKQENTVEAMFHSFRAFEGLAIMDAENHGISGKFGRKAFKSLKHRKQSEWNNHPYINKLIDLDVTDEAKRNDLLDQRNKLFHQLEGFERDDLFKAWDSDELCWQDKALGCLNFISEKDYKFVDFDQKEICNEVASLMVKVHQELEKAIADL